MNYYEYIFNVFASFISIYIDLLSVNLLSGVNGIKLGVKNILIMLLCSNIIVLNAIYGENLTRSFVTLIIALFYVYYITKLDFIKSFSYMIISHVFLGIYEVILSIFVIKLNIVNLNMYDMNAIIKAIFSFVIMSLVYITCKIKVIQKVSRNICNNKTINHFVMILLSIFSIVLIVLDFKYSQTFSKKIYLGNIILIVSLLLLLIFAIYNRIKVQKEIQKIEILLSFMSKYEKLIDEHRIMRHELLNNLLLLKSFKNKNTKDYNNLLNDLIDNYSNKGIKINNIYNLPSGLKGIFYYKLYGLEDKKYNININVSKKSSSLIKNINHNNYVSLNKIVGIVLDNAIESAFKTKGKIILIDIYTEDNSIIIEISNSFKGKVNLDTINEKYYSTKGNNRGLGLYILNNLIKNNNSISIKQVINNKNNIFTSKIKVSL